MANIGNILKIGGAVLAGVGGVTSVGVSTGVIPTRSAAVQNSDATETIVVEEYNYEYQHVINTKDTYWINGIEFSKEEWNAFLTNANAEATTLYYGAVDSYTEFTLDMLDHKEIISTTNEYNVVIDANLQYTLFAVPEAFEITDCKVNNFSIEIAELTTMDGYTVYSQPDSYEVWLQVYGEFTYTLTLK